MPTRPEEINEKITKAIKGKVPYFFIEAKKKELKNVAPITNSTVNRLRKIIPNPRMKYEDIAGVFDHKMLMSEDIQYVNHALIQEYKRLDRSKKWIIREEGVKDRNEGILFVYKHIREKLKEIEPDEERIVNVLVKDLFETRNSPNKETLWHCFGDIIYDNLKVNLNKTKQCESCGVRVKINNPNMKYCESCSYVKRLERQRMYMKK